MVEITRENLIEVLGDHEKREALLTAMKAEQGSYPPLGNLYCKLAPTCEATPEQLAAVVKSLLAYRHRYEWLLHDLIYHRDMPESILKLLLARRRFIDAMAHRSGPQWLLEEIARKFRISEAITSLALYYYGRPGYPTEDFAAFLREHVDDYMLRYNMVRERRLPPDKRAVVDELWPKRQPQSAPSE